jgi:hypothetical protein
MDLGKSLLGVMNARSRAANAFSQRLAYQLCCDIVLSRLQLPSCDMWA